MSKKRKIGLIIVILIIIVYVITFSMDISMGIFDPIQLIKDKKRDFKLQDELKELIKKDYGIDNPTISLYNKGRINKDCLISLGGCDGSALELLCTHKKGIYNWKYSVCPDEKSSFCPIAEFYDEKNEWYISNITFKEFFYLDSVVELLDKYKIRYKPVSQISDQNFLIIDYNSINDKNGFLTKLTEIDYKFQDYSFNDMIYFFNSKDYDTAIEYFKKRKDYYFSDLGRYVYDKDDLYSDLIQRISIYDFDFTCTDKKCNNYENIYYKIYIDNNIYFDVIGV